MSTFSPNSSSKPRIVLICTGLGRVNRGFEQYIASLAERLSEDNFLNADVEVWSGGKVANANYRHQRIRVVPRNWLERVGLKSGFLWEQRSFFAGMVWRLISQPPAVIYLGEYQVYCYLYKLRQWLGLHYSLVLYTGGQAIPGAGLFDPARDRIHHITPRYIPECRQWPAEAQVLAPHFVNDDFKYDTQGQQRLRQLAAGKKLVVSVGLLDKPVKRMDLLVAALAPLRDMVFPVLLGAAAADTAAIRKQLETDFGQSGFLMAELPHPQLGDYYTMADLFVSASPKESFGLALVEALWHGLPVLCADFEEARWVLGQHASYVGSQAVPDWTAAIEEALQEQPTQEQVEQSKSWANQRYSWQAVKEHYGKLFIPAAET